ncbi:hypothetical protein [Telluria aromaticivorans]|uniref:Uncharacterized protein n=1 Tax=Telluria aromaticivorans TaxID=2725995 RepID=A0A7Y2JWN6_9BURK|nr:hypothetical protein [Telluria aromaticivorans]NNG21955.1 hypothetical protein [Telluria aromaticivorans]
MVPNNVIAAGVFLLALAAHGGDARARQAAPPVAAAEQGVAADYERAGRFIYAFHKAGMSLAALKAAGKEAALSPGLAGRAHHLAQHYERILAAQVTAPDEELRAVLDEAASLGAAIAQWQGSAAAKEPAAAADSLSAAAAPTEESELPYRHYLELQRQLHGYLPPGPALVDLWFRATYPGMDEAGRDAYVPRGWAVAVRSRTAHQLVPMRRGGYFSLPAIQAAYDERGDILLDDAGRRWLGIWWTLRVPPGQRMPYAAIREARAQIAAVQAKISAFARYLKTVKRSPYDGIKACFHDDGGAILVNGKAVADAVEGQCKVLFDDPARDGADMVEFSGALDVVSFIDGRYYPRKR